MTYGNSMKFNIFVQEASLEHSHPHSFLATLHNNSRTEWWKQRLYGPRI